MHPKGMKSTEIFNVNAGLWILHHDVSDTVCGVCFEWWEFCKERGFVFTEEAPLAYATDILCGVPKRGLGRFLVSIPLKLLPAIENADAASCRPFIRRIHV